MIRFYRVVAGHFFYGVCRSGATYSFNVRFLSPGFRAPIIRLVATAVSPRKCIQGVGPLYYHFIWIRKSGNTPRYHTTYTTGRPYWPSFPRSGYGSPGIYDIVARLSPTISVVPTGFSCAPAAQLPAARRRYLARRLIPGRSTMRLQTHTPIFRRNSNTPDIWKQRPGATVNQKKARK